MKGAAMSIHVTVHVPTRVATPRGALWVERLAGTVQAFLRAAKAQRLARRRAQEAAEVRAYAHQLERSMPGMAADLYAAADRHLG
jgi:hypothetical protein